MDKYRRAWQATGDNVAHAHFMLDAKGYKLTYLVHGAESSLRS